MPTQTAAAPIKIELSFVEHADQLLLNANGYTVAGFERWCTDTSTKERVLSKMQGLALLPAAKLTRLVWRNKHADMRSITNGVKWVLVYEDGTRLVPLLSLTTPQLLKALLYANI